jgi:starvation-inducible DNA-binding protein
MESRYRKVLSTLHAASQSWEGAPSIVITGLPAGHRRANEHAIKPSIGAEVSMNIERSLEIHADAVTQICLELKKLLADVFVLYLKTKNVHWHMRGPHFRDYHLLLGEHADQLFAMTDEIAERSRKLGGTTVRSIGDIARHQRLKDNEKERVPATMMLTELLADNQNVATYLRSAHEVCESFNDVATASLIENWIDQTERRCWFLAEITEAE